LPAEPFEFFVDTPWYIVGANAFDLQHFGVAHDRTLVDEPLVESPSPFARRITATYDVTGSGWRDELTRRFSGPRVRMSVTVWAGTPHSRGRSSCRRRCGRSTSPASRRCRI